MVWIKDKDARELLNALLDDYHWRWKPAGNSGHAKGILMCPYESQGGCWHSINGTPRASNLLYLKRIYRNCEHKPSGEVSPF